MSSDTFAASRIRALKGAAGAGFVLLATGGAAAQEDPAVFYAGKTVRIIVGVSVGSGYDIAARTVGRHIGKYIPGKPNIIVQNQPGAGSATMSNALYASGPRDGTVIGAPFNGMPTIPLFAPEQARFDPTKLNWVGSTNRAVQTTYVWSAEPTIQTMEDINTRTFVVGSQAPGTAQNDFPVLANLLLGTRFSVVNGYESTPKIHLAMERGEVMGSAATSLSTLKVTSGDWIPDKKIRIIGQWGLKPHPELPDVPMWLAQAKSEADRQALRLLLARLEFGQPYFLPPDVPAARVAAVRRAFDSTLRDPDFLADAARAKLEVEPVTGEQVQRLIADIFATPPEVVARVRKALEAK